MTDAWVEKVRLELIATGDPIKAELASAIQKGLDPNNANTVLTKVVTVIDRTPAGNSDNLLGGIAILKVK